MTNIQRNIGIVKNKGSHSYYEILPVCIYLYLPIIGYISINEEVRIHFHVYGLFLKNGGNLLSHFYAVPSARPGLTSLFGMGRGGAPVL